MSQDVGSTGLPGGASFASGTFTVRGAGADLWDTTDGFQYVYQTLSGNGQIIARVTGIASSNSFAKAGVMIRASLAANAAHVILDLRPTTDIEFMTRPGTGAATAWLAGEIQAPPAWLKLVRSGPTITGSVSANGTTWRTVGSTTLTIPANALVGLIVTSHDTTTLSTATFDNVAVTAGPAAPMLTTGAATPPAATPPATPGAPAP
jgi:regulation of enolase protein 1 (concanavalin A-like superfamily)